MHEPDDVLFLVAIQLPRQVGNVARRVVEPRAGRIELALERGTFLGSIVGAAGVAEAAGVAGATAGAAAAHAVNASSDSSDSAPGLQKLLSTRADTGLRVEFIWA